MPLQPCGGWTQHALFNPWSVFQLAHAHTRHAHSHDHHDTIFTQCFLLLSWNWIDFPFFLLSFDCFDFLGLFSSICFGRNALAASSLVGRSIFICSYSLTWLQMMVQRLARPPSSNCSNPFEQAQRCWSCFSSRSIFPHSDTNRDTHTHTVSNFSTSSPAQFFPQNFLSLARAAKPALSLRKSVVVVVVLRFC